MRDTKADGTTAFDDHPTRVTEIVGTTGLQIDGQNTALADALILRDYYREKYRSLVPVANHLDRACAALRDEIVSGVAGESVALADNALAEHRKWSAQYFEAPADDV